MRRDIKRNRFNWFHHEDFEDFGREKSKLPSFRPRASPRKTNPQDYVIKLNYVLCRWFVLFQRKLKGDQRHGVSPLLDHAVSSCQSTGVWRLGWLGGIGHRDCLGCCQYGREAGGLTGFRRLRSRAPKDESYIHPPRHPRPTLLKKKAAWGHVSHPLCSSIEGLRSLWLADQ